MTSFLYFLSSAQVKMAVTRTSVVRRRRKSVKARRPWARTIRSMGTDASFRSVIPRIRNPDFGYPDKLVTKLRYCDTLNVTGAVNVIGANVFRMNSLFDPDLSGTGHQPMYYDQLCGAVGTAPYSRYRVLSSKMTVSFTPLFQSNPAATAYGPYIVGITGTATSGLYATTVSALTEASGTVWTHMGDKSGGNNVKKLTCSYIPSRDLGVDAGDDTVAAQYNANPTNVYHAIPWKVDLGNAGSVTMQIEIEYKVEFYTRNEVGQS